VLGVVITLFDKRTNISRDTHGQIRTVFGEVLFKTKISKTCGWKKVPRIRKQFDVRAEVTRRSRIQEAGCGGYPTCEESRVTRHAEDAA